MVSFVDIIQNNILIYRGIQTQAKYTLGKCNNVHIEMAKAYGK